MDVIGNNDGKDDKIVILCRWKVAGLLDFAHKVWYATVGILAQTYRAYFALCRNNNYEIN